MFGKRTFFFLHLLAASWDPGRDARRCVSKNHQSSQKIINRLKKSSIASKTYQTLQKTSNASILNLNLFISEKFILFPIQRIVFYVINNPLIILVPLNNTVVKPGLPAKTGIYF